MAAVMSAARSSLARGAVATDNAISLRGITRWTPFRYVQSFVVVSLSVDGKMKEGRGGFFLEEGDAFVRVRERGSLGDYD